MSRARGAHRQLAAEIAAGSDALGAEVEGFLAALGRDGARAAA
jgi:hypothetical protein